MRWFNNFLINMIFLTYKREWRKYLALAQGWDINFQRYVYFLAYSQFVCDDCHMREDFLIEQTKDSRKRPTERPVWMFDNTRKNNGLNGCTKPATQWNVKIIHV